MERATRPSATARLYRRQNVESFERLTQRSEEFPAQRLSHGSHGAEELWAPSGARNQPRLRGDCPYSNIGHAQGARGSGSGPVTSRRWPWRPSRQPPIGPLARSSRGPTFCPGHGHAEDRSVEPELGQESPGSSWSQAAARKALVQLVLKTAVLTGVTHSTSATVRRNWWDLGIGKLRRAGIKHRSASPELLGLRNRETPGWRTCLFQRRRARGPCAREGPSSTRLQSCFVTVTLG
jgi:hypothetical protein